MQYTCELRLTSLFDSFFLNDVLFLVKNWQGCYLDKIIIHHRIIVCENVKLVSTGSCRGFKYTRAVLNGRIQSASLSVGHFAGFLSSTFVKKNAL